MLSRCAKLLRYLVMLVVVGCGNDQELDAEKAKFDEMVEQINKHVAELNKLDNLYPVQNSDKKRIETKPEAIQQEWSIALTDLDLVLRKVILDHAIDEVSVLFISETEITNSMFAAYLSDTEQMRDDSAIEQAVQFKRGTTSSPVIHIDDSASLWRNGELPQTRDDHPVSFVTVSQAMKFCEWLNARYDCPGSFRLPTEAEWLFAAYGSDRKFPWGDDERPCARSSTEPVKARPELRTPDGLYGMWGNVSELILSPFNGYGGRVINYKSSPFITQWLGPSYREESVRGQPVQPRQDYWGYTHSLKSRSDTRGFRIVFVPSE
jgi:hypothetical protein